MPKSQVCLFAVANIAQARAQTLRAKGPNALWIPATRKAVPLSLHSFFREGKRLQLLRVRLKESRTHGSCSDVAFVKAESSCLSPCDRRKFKQDGIAKVFAMLPHLGRALMRPRWRNFAKQKAPTVMRDRRDGGEAPEGTSGLIFFRPFFVQRQRKDIKNGTAQREAVCASVEEVA